MLQLTGSSRVKLEQAYQKTLAKLSIIPFAVADKLQIPL